MKKIKKYITVLGAAVLATLFSNFSGSVFAMCTDDYMCNDDSFVELNCGKSEIEFEYEIEREIFGPDFWEMLMINNQLKQWRDEARRNAYGTMMNSRVPIDD